MTAFQPLLNTSKASWPPGGTLAKRPRMAIRDWEKMLRAGVVSLDD